MKTETRPAQARLRRRVTRALTRSSLPEERQAMSRRRAAVAMMLALCLVLIESTGEVRR